MAAPSDYILFFGDHMSDKVSLIRNLVLLSKGSPAVRRLLHEANDTLQLELSRLSRLEHGWSEKFESLIELAEANASADELEGGQNGIITCALCCIGRLGELVAQANFDYSILGTPSASQHPVEVVGLCMGLLPAAVAVAAKDTSQIFTLAREILKVTIRMAYGIWLRMRLVDSFPGSWSQTFLRVPAETATRILDQFHEQCKVPIVRRVALGVTSKGFVTLFGPPTTLEKLQTWTGAEELRNATQALTEAGGCVHTPYLPRLDMEEIFSGCSKEFLEWPLDPNKSRMASPDRLTYYSQPTLGGLLAEIIEDIAHNVLRLDGCIENCVSRLKADNRTGNIKLVVMGQNGHVPAMSGELKKADIGHEIISSTLPSTRIPSTIIDNNQNNAVQSNRGLSGLIAIIGMSGRFPDNDTVQGFWEDLLDGKTHIREVPSDRFDVTSWHDPTLETKNSTTATKGAWLANPGLFDHRLFNISPREAAQIDPIHRFLLTCSYEALQHAGYNPGASLSMDGSNISTFFGQLGEDWHDIIHEQGADIYYVPGIARTFAPSRVNYHFKFGGGSYAVDSACASSITTIVLACQALASRACDMALAGGGSMMYTPVPFSGLSRSGMISSTDGCRTFHDDADGYARGEGVGVVVLKRLEDAISDNDNILGVIRGSARTYSTTTTSITHPSHQSQERVYKRVLAQSSLDPSEIVYVEMHGTGTQAGDFEEMTSVINVMAPPGSRSRMNPLTVGTVKAAVGHGEAAAGVTALIKLLLMLRDKVIPGQPGWPFKINHRFPPLEPLNVRIATQHYPLKPSPKGDKKIKLLLNSFDASGGESCLAIEEAPRIAEERAGAKDPRTAHVVALSGRTSISLAGNRQRLLNWLELHPNVKLEDLAYTTTARRMHEPLRVAYVAKSVPELVQQLQDDAVAGEDPKAKPKPAGRIFLFTGQGSQYPAMGSVLFSTNKTFRDKLLAYQKMATHMGLPSFVELIINPEYLDVASTTQIQMAIVALEISVAETFAQYGVTPTAVVGHSLGEYAALCVAGVLSVTDALYLVGQRALLMERLLTPKCYAMLATSTSAEKLQSEYTSLGLSSCSIACKNAPMVTVASGTVEDIERLELHLKAQGARAKLLRVSYGFHSSQVDPILAEFTELASGVVFKAPVVPVISSYLGRLVPAGDHKTFDPRYLAEQCRGTVDFVGAIRAAAAGEKTSIDKTLWIETGPEPILLGLVRWTLPDLPPSNLLGAVKPSPLEDNWSTLSGVLKAAYESGVDVDWPQFHKNFKSCVRLLELPFYAFDFRDFWHEPFKRPEFLQTESTTTVATGSSHSCSCVQAAVTPPKPSFLPSFPGFPTTSLPTVEREEVDIGSGEMEAVFSADTAEPDLLRTIEGHVVHGHVICPMSVLVDMALTAAKYCHFRLHNETETPVMSVTDVEMNNALVLHPNMTKKPVIRVKAVMHKNEASALISFSWINFKGERADPEETTGGTCKVQFEQVEKWPTNVNNSLFLVKARIEALRAAACEGRAHRLLKPVVYRMFTENVDYSEPFRGIDEAILDLDCRDAIATVRLSHATSTGNFVMNPFWTDALTHLGGFFINSGLRYAQQDLLCMARGFDSWRVVGQGNVMKPGKTYTNYTFMQDVEGNLVVGDCYILDENDNLVQTLLGLKFQKLKRSVVDTVFGTMASSKSAVSPKKPTTISRQTTAPKRFVSQPALASPAASKGVVCANDDISSSPQSPITHPASTSSDVEDARDLLHAILSIVAKEAGCHQDDLVDEAVFADLGIDSLMGISILAVIKRETEIDLDSTFFIQFETVKEARRALEEILGVDDLEETPQTVSEGPTNSDLASQHMIREVSDLPTPPPEKEMHRMSSLAYTSTRQVPAMAVAVSGPPSPSLETAVKKTSNATSQGLAAKLVHLSGPRANSDTRLFFLADETGTSLSCIQLPAVTCSKGKPISVWGVESPFVKQHGLLEGHSIQDIARISLDSIREQQISGSGPFLLGGLGAGASVAIEVARVIESESPSDSVSLVLFDPSFTPGDIKAALSAPGVRIKSAQKDHSSAIAESSGDHARLYYRARSTFLDSALAKCANKDRWCGDWEGCSYAFSRYSEYEQKLY
ncbi:Conidial yellow pigment biosynthesis polyketide synthase 5 [Colletotrichum chlorophyti]|uniref:Conidial yellow pigment biosynthesis polyketide synthase 5 n=1 Tax=Colletotrichum chlorophyti TaxID=708187 RepID=A0A1Q8RSU0_9PEZI|nr:Conidial yellow pigment biosynthesis polyketide synthase 5 [Colletotrichum chlorophyti]